MVPWRLGRLWQIYFCYTCPLTPIVYEFTVADQLYFTSETQYFDISEPEDSVNALPGMKNPSTVGEDSVVYLLPLGKLMTQ